MNCCIHGQSCCWKRGWAVPFVQLSLKKGLSLVVHVYSWISLSTAEAPSQSKMICDSCWTRGVCEGLPQGQVHSFVNVTPVQTWRKRIKLWEQSSPNATWHKAQQRISWQVGGGGGKNPKPVCLSRSTRVMWHEACRKSTESLKNVCCTNYVLPNTPCANSSAPLAQHLARGIPWGAFLSLQQYLPRRGERLREDDSIRQQILLSLSKFKR